MRLKDLSIMTKLITAFLLVLAVFSGLLVHQQLNLLLLEELQNEGANRAEAALFVGDIDSRLEHLYSILGDAVINGDLEAANANFAEFKIEALKDIDALGSIVDTPEEKKIHKQFAESYAAYLDLVENRFMPALKSGEKRIESVREIDNKIKPLRNACMESLDSIKASLEKEMANADETFDSTIIKMEEVSMIAGAVGVALGLVLAFSISLMIVRPLKRTSEYAQAVARGQINDDLEIRQYDEVGQVAWGMRRVTESLRNVLAEFNATISDIRRGRLRARGDKDKYQGAYANLIGTANTLADVMVGYLDDVPNPIMCIDTDFKVQFMNKAGAELDKTLPEKLEDQHCSGIFQTSDCDSEKCACRQAMKIKGKAESATDAHPGGLDLMISYTGMPILDEAGKVVGAFELVVDETAIKTSQIRMQNVARQAAQISDRLASAAEEISSQVEQSNKGAGIQRERAMESATAMEEMNSTVLEVARNASNAAENAEETKTRAQTGSEVVDKVIQAMGKVQTSAQGLKTSMADLGTQAEGIGAIMNVISDIADQTNLLALNAAIEAARAGDAGRGFAVVADEVRKLAEKTMTATNEVGQAIQAIQNGTKSSIASTDQAVDAIGRSTVLANQSGEVLGEIVGFAEDTADQVRAIATSAEEQSAVAEQINRSTEEISRISAETADAMDQSAQAVQELASLAAELQGLISELGGSDS